jgi:hypothetical protein
MEEARSGEMGCPSTDTCGISPIHCSVTRPRPPVTPPRERANRRTPATGRGRAGKGGDRPTATGSSTDPKNRSRSGEKCLDKFPSSSDGRFLGDLRGNGGSRHPVRRGKGKIAGISRMWKVDALPDAMTGKSRANSMVGSPMGRRARPLRQNPANRRHRQFFVLDWQDPILIKFHPCLSCIRYTLSGSRALRPWHHSPPRATFRRYCKSKRSSSFPGHRCCPGRMESMAVSFVAGFARRATAPSAMGDHPWMAPGVSHAEPQAVNDRRGYGEEKQFHAKRR